MHAERRRFSAVVLTILVLSSLAIFSGPHTGNAQGANKECIPGESENSKNTCAGTYDKDGKKTYDANCKEENKQVAGDEQKTGIIGKGCTVDGVPGTCTEIGVCTGTKDKEGETLDQKKTKDAASSESERLKQISESAKKLLDSTRTPTLPGTAIDPFSMPQMPDQQRDGSILQQYGYPIPGTNAENLLRLSELSEASWTDGTLKAQADILSPGAINQETLQQLREMGGRTDGQFRPAISDRPAIWEPALYTSSDTFRDMTAQAAEGTFWERNFERARTWIAAPLESMRQITDGLFVSDSNPRLFTAGVPGRDFATVMRDIQSNMDYVARTAPLQEPIIYSTPEGGTYIRNPDGTIQEVSRGAELTGREGDLANTEAKLQTAKMLSQMDQERLAELEKKIAAERARLESGGDLNPTGDGLNRWCWNGNAQQGCAGGELLTRDEYMRRLTEERDRLKALQESVQGKKGVVTLADKNKTRLSADAFRQRIADEIARTERTLSLLAQEDGRIRINLTDADGTVRSLTLEEHRAQLDDWSNAVMRDQETLRSRIAALDAQLVDVSRLQALESDVLRGHQFRLQAEPDYAATHAKALAEAERRVSEARRSYEFAQTAVEADMFATPEDRVATPDRLTSLTEARNRLLTAEAMRTSIERGASLSSTAALLRAREYEAEIARLSASYTPGMSPEESRDIAERVLLAQHNAEMYRAEAARVERDFEISMRQLALAPSFDRLRALELERSQLPTPTVWERIVGENADVAARRDALTTEIARTREEIGMNIRPIARLAALRSEVEFLFGEREQTFTADPRLISYMEGVDPIGDRMTELNRQFDLIAGGETLPSYLHIDAIIAADAARARSEGILARDVDRFMTRLDERGLAYAEQTIGPHIRDSLRNVSAANDALRRLMTGEITDDMLDPRNSNWLTRNLNGATESIIDWRDRWWAPTNFSSCGGIAAPECYLGNASRSVWNGALYLGSGVGSLATDLGARTASYLADDVYGVSYDDKVKNLTRQGYQQVGLIVGQAGLVALDASAVGSLARASLRSVISEASAISRIEMRALTALETEYQARIAAAAAPELAPRIAVAAENASAALSRAGLEHADGLVWRAADGRLVGYIDDAGRAVMPAADDVLRAALPSVADDIAEAGARIADDVVPVAAPRQTVGRAAVDDLPLSAPAPRVVMPIDPRSGYFALGTDAGRVAVRGVSGAERAALGELAAEQSIAAEMTVLREASIPNVQAITSAAARQRAATASREALFEGAGLSRGAGGSIVRADGLPIARIDSGRVVQTVPNASRSFIDRGVAIENAAASPVARPVTAGSVPTPRASSAAPQAPTPPVPAAPAPVARLNGGGLPARIEQGSLTKAIEQGTAGNVTPVAAPKAIPSGAPARPTFSATPVSTPIAQVPKPTIFGENVTSLASKAEARGAQVLAMADTTPIAAARAAERASQAALQAERLSAQRLGAARSEAAQLESDLAAASVRNDAAQVARIRGELDAAQARIATITNETEAARAAGVRGFGGNGRGEVLDMKTVATARTNLGLTDPVTRARTALADMQGRVPALEARIASGDIAAQSQLSTLQRTIAAQERIVRSLEQAATAPRGGAGPSSPRGGGSRPQGGLSDSEIRARQEVATRLESTRGETGGPTAMLRGANDDATRLVQEGNVVRVVEEASPAVSVPQGAVRSLDEFVGSANPRTLPTAANDNMRTLVGANDNTPLRKMVPANDNAPLRASPVLPPAAAQAPPIGLLAKGALAPLRDGFGVPTAQESVFTVRPQEFTTASLDVPSLAVPLSIPDAVAVAAVRANPFPPVSFAEPQLSTPFADITASPVSSPRPIVSTRSPLPLPGLSASGPRSATLPAFPTLGGIAAPAQPVASTPIAPRLASLTPAPNTSGRERPLIPGDAGYTPPVYAPGYAPGVVPPTDDPGGDLRRAYEAEQKRIQDEQRRRFFESQVQWALQRLRTMNPSEAARFEREYGDLAKLPTTDQLFTQLTTLLARIQQATLNGGALAGGAGGDTGSGTTKDPVAREEDLDARQAQVDAARARLDKAMRDLAAPIPDGIQTVAAARPDVPVERLVRDRQMAALQRAAGELERLGLSGETASIRRALWEMERSRIHANVTGFESDASGGIVSLTRGIRAAATLGSGIQTVLPSLPQTPVVTLGSTAEGAITIAIRGVVLNDLLPEGAYFVHDDARYECSLTGGCISLRLDRIHEPEFIIATLHEIGHLRGYAPEINIEMDGVQSQIQETRRLAASRAINVFEHDRRLSELYRRKAQLLATAEYGAWAYALRTAVWLYQQTGVDALVRMDALLQAETAFVQAFRANRTNLESQIRAAGLGTLNTEALIAYARQIFDLQGPSLQSAIDVNRNHIASLGKSVAQAEPLAPERIIESIATALSVRDVSAERLFSGLEEALGHRSTAVAEEVSPVQASEISAGSVVRTSRASNAGTYFGLAIDPANNRLINIEQPQLSIAISPTEEAILLELLDAAPGAYTTKDQLMMNIYSPASMPESDRIIQVYMHALRPKLAAVNPSLRIESGIGSGWRVYDTKQDGVAVGTDTLDARTVAFLAENGLRITQAYQEKTKTLRYTLENAQTGASAEIRLPQILILDALARSAGTFVSSSVIDKARLFDAPEGSAPLGGLKVRISTLRKVLSSVTGALEIRNNAEIGGYALVTKEVPAVAIPVSEALPKVSSAPGSELKGISNASDLKTTTIETGKGPIMLTWPGSAAVEFDRSATLSWPRATGMRGLAGSKQALIEDFINDSARGGTIRIDALPFSREHIISDAGTRGLRFVSPEYPGQIVTITGLGVVRAVNDSPAGRFEISPAELVHREGLHVPSGSLQVSSDGSIYTEYAIDPLGTYDLDSLREKVTNTLTLGQGFGPEVLGVFRFSQTLTGGFAYAIPDNALYPIDILAADIMASGPSFGSLYADALGTFFRTVRDMHGEGIAHLGLHPFNWFVYTAEGTPRVVLTDWEAAMRIDSMPDRGAIPGARDRTELEAAFDGLTPQQKAFALDLRIALTAATPFSQGLLANMPDYEERAVGSVGRSLAPAALAYDVASLARALHEYSGRPSDGRSLAQTADEISRRYETVVRETLATRIESGQEPLSPTDLFVARQAMQRVIDSAARALAAEQWDGFGVARATASGPVVLNSAPPSSADARLTIAHTVLAQKVRPPVSGYGSRLNSGVPLDLLADIFQSARRFMEERGYGKGRVQLGTLEARIAEQSEILRDLERQLASTEGIQELVILEQISSVRRLQERAVQMSLVIARRNAVDPTVREGLRIAIAQSAEALAAYRAERSAYRSALKMSGSDSYRLERGLALASVHGSRAEAAIDQSREAIREILAASRELRQISDLETIARAELLDPEDADLTAAQQALAAAVRGDVSAAVQELVSIRNPAIAAFVESQLPAGATRPNSLGAAVSDRTAETPLTAADSLEDILRGVRYGGVNEYGNEVLVNAVGGKLHRIDANPKVQYVTSQLMRPFINAAAIIFNPATQGWYSYEPPADLSKVVSPASSVLADIEAVQLLFFDRDHDVMFDSGGAIVEVSNVFIGGGEHYLYDFAAAGNFWIRIPDEEYYASRIPRDVATQARLMDRVSRVARFYGSADGVSHIQEAVHHTGDRIDLMFQRRVQGQRPQEYSIAEFADELVRRARLIESIIVERVPLSDLLLALGSSARPDEVAAAQEALDLISQGRAKEAVAILEGGRIENTELALIVQARLPDGRPASLGAAAVRDVVAEDVSKEFRAISSEIDRILGVETGTVDLDAPAPTSLFNALIDEKFDIVASFVPQIRALEPRLLSLLADPSLTSDARNSIESALDRVRVVVADLDRFVATGQLSGADPAESLRLAGTTLEVAAARIGQPEGELTIDGPAIPSFLVAPRAVAVETASEPSFFERYREARSSVVGFDTLTPITAEEYSGIMLERYQTMSNIPVAAGPGRVMLPTANGLVFQQRPDGRYDVYRPIQQGVLESIRLAWRGDTEELPLPDPIPQNASPAESPSQGIRGVLANLRETLDPLAPIEDELTGPPPLPTTIDIQDVPGAKTVPAGGPIQDFVVIENAGRLGADFVRSLLYAAPPEGTAFYYRGIGETWTPTRSGQFFSESLDDALAYLARNARPESAPSLLRIAVSPDVIAVQHLKNLLDYAIGTRDSLGAIGVEVPGTWFDPATAPIDASTLAAGLVADIEAALGANPSPEIRDRIDSIRNRLAAIEPRAEQEISDVFTETRVVDPERVADLESVIAAVRENAASEQPPPAAPSLPRPTLHYVLTEDVLPRLVGLDPQDAAIQILDDAARGAIYLTRPLPGEDPGRTAYTFSSLEAAARTYVESNDRMQDLRDEQNGVFARYRTVAAQHAQNLRALYEGDPESFSAAAAEAVREIIAISDDYRWVSRELYDVAALAKDAQAALVSGAATADAFGRIVNETFILAKENEEILIRAFEALTQAERHAYATKQSGLDVSEADALYSEARQLLQRAASAASPSADTEYRDQLFEEWVRGLANPLTDDATGFADRLASSLRKTSFDRRAQEFDELVLPSRERIAAVSAELAVFEATLRRASAGESADPQEPAGVSQSYVASVVPAAFEALITYAAPVPIPREWLDALGVELPRRATALVPTVWRGGELDISSGRRAVAEAIDTYTWGELVYSPAVIGLIEPPIIDADFTVIDMIADGIEPAALLIEPAALAMLPSPVRFVAAESRAYVDALIGLLPRTPPPLPEWAQAPASGHAVPRERLVDRMRAIRTLEATGPLADVSAPRLIDRIRASASRIPPPLPSTWPPPEADVPDPLPMETFSPGADAIQTVILSPDLVARTRALVGSRDVALLARAFPELVSLIERDQYVLTVAAQSHGAAGDGATAETLQTASGEHAIALSELWLAEQSLHDLREFRSPLARMRLWREVDASIRNALEALSRARDIMNGEALVPSREAPSGSSSIRGGSGTGSGGSDDGGSRIERLKRGGLIASLIAGLFGGIVAVDRWMDTPGEEAAPTEGDAGKPSTVRTSKVQVKDVPTRPADRPRAPGTLKSIPLDPPRDESRVPSEGEIIDALERARDGQPLPDGWTQDGDEVVAWNGERYKIPPKEEAPSDVKTAPETPPAETETPRTKTAPDTGKMPPYTGGQESPGAAGMPDNGLTKATNGPGGFGNIFGLLNQLRKLAGLAPASEKPKDAQQGAAWITLTPDKLIAQKGDRVKLEWNGTGVANCTVYAQTGPLAMGGAKGVVETPPLEKTSVFRLVCLKVGGGVVEVFASVRIPGTPDPTQAELSAQGMLTSEGAGSPAVSLPPVNNTCNPQDPRMNLRTYLACIGHPYDASWGVR